MCRKLVSAVHNTKTGTIGLQRRVILAPTQNARTTRRFTKHSIFLDATRGPSSDAESQIGLLLDHIVM